jgi:hypothetical protein
MDISGKRMLEIGDVGLIGSQTVEKKPSHFLFLKVTWLSRLEIG